MRVTELGSSPSKPAPGADQDRLGRSPTGRPTGQKVLVTGGAGYIGAHTCKALREQGYMPIVFDNLSSGYEQAVRWGPLVRGDIRDTAAVRAAIERYEVTAVIHFASLIEVGRSMSRPDIFYDTNVVGTLRLLDALQDTAVRRLVFSSSAAVYGATAETPLALLDESLPKDPSSPYGDTKLACERMIANYCRAFGVSAVALRYFNAAGADPFGAIGEAHDPETHLIPLAVRAALGTGKPLTVFGNDFDTPDGSCLRDYVHVNDLAAAHLAALRAERPSGAFEAVNIGAGAGRSVFEVIDAVATAVGRPVPYSVGDRRAGDPASLVANPGLAWARLGWKPLCSGLDRIAQDAAAWHRDPAYGPDKAQLASSEDTAAAPRRTPTSRVKTQALSA